MKRILACLAACFFAACGSANAPAPAEPQTQTLKEVPITSKSPEAIEHFRKGRDLSDNLRQSEAAGEFDQAVKLDPDFALALAYRGNSTPGAAGLKDIEDAKAKSASASKPEQLLIDAMLAGRRGEIAKSSDGWSQLAEAVPGDWRVHMGRGSQLVFAQKYQEAIDSLNKAVSINPNAGPAYNMIGYAHLAQGETAPAIEALTKYAAVNPNEPNPQDSLGEALMAGGRFADAEAAFRKAASMGTGFPIALEGVAYTKFFAADWAGGRQALAEARKAAQRPNERMDVDLVSAMATLGEGRTAEGLKQLDALGASPDATPVDAAFTPIYRGIALIETARYRDASAEATKALERAKTTDLPPVAKANLERWGLTVHVAAAGLTGDAAAAQKDVESLQSAASARPDNPQLQSAVHFAQGMEAAAKKDLKTAKMHFDMCARSDSYCHWQAAVVSQKANDRAGADASRARLTQAYVRDPVYLFLRSVANRTPAKPSN
jgi:tetratricopeptide (TPR) repeat protein